MWKPRTTVREFDSSNQEFDRQFEQSVRSENTFTRRPIEDNANDRQPSERSSNTDRERISESITSDRWSSQEKASGVCQNDDDCSWDDYVEIEKPQSKFKWKVDNSMSPFKPSLRSKPNAIQPLRIVEECDKDGTTYFSHPYLHELKAFEVPFRQLEVSVPIPALDIESSPDVIIVDDDESLALMIAELEEVDEIAIDSEFHHLRSFYGFLCILQISTRTQDYVIDTIALRYELEVLNKFFTDPNILKVMHAASCDVTWLQKDLNLYLVNLFDTSIAASELGSGQLGLANALKRYCDVTIEKNKDFQKFYDWRERPLSWDALSYSRDDTHYLLYLYDILRNELIAKSKSTESLLKVYNRGRDLCMKTYKKPPSGLPALLRKFPNDYKKRYAMKSLYEWRDSICREMDESTGYVLPIRVLLQLVNTLPKTEEEIKDAFWPSSIPSITELSLPQLIGLISEARKQPENGDSLPLSSQRREIKTHSQATQTDNNCDIRSQSTRTFVSQSTQTEIVDEDVDVFYDSEDWC